MTSEQLCGEMVEDDNSRKEAGRENQRQPRISIAQVSGDRLGCAESTGTGAKMAAKGNGMLVARTVDDNSWKENIWNKLPEVVIFQAVADNNT